MDQVGFREAGRFDMLIEMVDCVAYNNILISYQNYEGIDMKNCIQCNEIFYARHSSKCCSLKCKILANIQKLDNGCWIYKKSCSGAYGKIRWNMKWYSAHRISFEQFIGPIEQNKWVCHTCDTPKCVNPEHLFLGTASENRRDAIIKKRVIMKGEENHFSKFSDTQIEEMRKLKNEGLTYSRLSRIFNCSIAHLYNVVKNKCRRISNGV